MVSSRIGVTSAQHGLEFLVVVGYQEDIIHSHGCSNVRMSNVGAKIVPLKAIQQVIDVHLIKHRADNTALLDSL